MPVVRKGGGRGGEVGPTPRVNPATPRTACKRHYRQDRPEPPVRSAVPVGRGDAAGRGAAASWEARAGGVPRRYGRLPAGRRKSRTATTSRGATRYGVPVPSQN